MAPNSGKIDSPSLVQKSEDIGAPGGIPLSSGFLKYPKKRDAYLKNPEMWLNGKKAVDDVGSWWRVHDNLYDLTNFIHKHPGGSFWLEKTQGTDITELFECSHVGSKAEKILANYFVEEAVKPRNSPYTFHEDGFYRELKRKASPILDKVGRGPSLQMRLLQDSLVLSFVCFFFLAGWHSSLTMAVVAGLILTLSTSSAHNYMHQKDSWRMYIVDMMFISSKDWRISHIFSHHIFPNTIYDYEVSAFEPFIQLLPKTSKTWFDRYGTALTSYIVFIFGFPFEFTNRIIAICRRQSKINPEDGIIVIQLLVMILLTESFLKGIGFWMLVHTVANTAFLNVALMSSHHHPEIYHEGDALTSDRDWGLLQVAATREKGELFISSLFLISVSFGHHTLHHLFPTIDHSKLNYLMPAFLETCQEFGVKFELFSLWKLWTGLYLTLAKNKPNPNIPNCFKSNVS